MSDSVRILTRKQAAQFLATLGYPITPGHLGNLASNNNARRGPPYTRIGWKTVRYREDDLAAWYNARAVRVE